MTLSERFWSNVDRGANCWIWTGSLREPYGAFSIGAHLFLAHRISYELCIGEITPGKQVLHRCDTPLCVRPEHLFLGTQKDNIHDMHTKGRFTPPRGEKCGTSKLTWEQVRAMRSTYTGAYGQQADLARQFNVSRTTIHDIIIGKKWSTDPVVIR